MKCVNIFWPCLVLLVRGTLQSPDESKLIDDLFTRYTKYVRPAKTPKESVEVKFASSLQAIEKLDLAAETFTTKLWLNFQWKDYRLSWDPDEYGGSQSIRLPSSMLWIPDILLYNSANDHFDNLLHHTDIVVYSSGTLSWVPAGTFLASCAYDVTWYPYDIQTCKLKFGSWTYDGSKLNLTSYSDTMFLSTYSLNKEWELLDAQAKRTVQKYDCCPEPYIDVTFTLELKRRSASKALEIFFPPSLLAVIMLFSFTLPVNCGERITLGMVQLVSLAGFWVIKSQETPHSFVVSLEDSFYATMFFGSFIAFLATCFSVKIFYCSAEMPEWLQALCQRCGGSFCCSGFGFYNAGDAQNLVNRRNSDEEKEPSVEMNKNWILLSRMIDRFSFILFLIYIILAAICILGSVP